jgi:hypothetical protein
MSCAGAAAAVRHDIWRQASVFSSSAKLACRAEVGEAGRPAVATAAAAHLWVVQLGAVGLGVDGLVEEDHIVSGPRQQRAVVEAQDLRGATQQGREQKG